MPRKFICECCKQEKITKRPEKDAAQEAADLFPGLDINNPSQAAPVCEPCFIKIMRHNNDNRYIKYIED